MTAKEKAQELINEFRKYASGDDDDYRFSPAIEKENAKLCAVLAVDEVLRAAFYAKDDVYDYYMEVKLEIHKL